MMKTNAMPAVCGIASAIIFTSVVIILSPNSRIFYLERAKRFELSTVSLATKGSTTELRPLILVSIEDSNLTAELI